MIQIALKIKYNKVYNYFRTYTFPYWQLPHQPPKPHPPRVPNTGKCKIGGKILKWKFIAF